MADSQAPVLCPQSESETSSQNDKQTDYDSEFVNTNDDELISIGDGSVENKAVDSSLQDDGASNSVYEGDLSDEQNTSLLYPIKESEDDAQRLRKYRERKIRKLVDKCRTKNIHFPLRFVQISTKLSLNISSCTDAELVELTTECLQSLGSDNDADSSSSDSSGETTRKKRKRVGGLLTRSPRNFDPTNPYNQAWSQNYHPRHSYSCEAQQQIMGGSVRITPQEQHDIFQQQVYGNQPSLEMNYQHPQARKMPLISSFLNTPTPNISYDNQNITEATFNRRRVAYDFYQSAESVGTSSVGVGQPLFSSTPESPAVSETTNDEKHAGNVNENSTDTGHSKNTSEVCQNVKDVPAETFNRDVQQSVDGTNNGHNTGPLNIANHISPKEEDTSTIPNDDSNKPNTSEEADKIPNAPLEVNNSVPKPDNAKPEAVQPVPKPTSITPSPKPNDKPQQVKPLPEPNDNTPSPKPNGITPSPKPDPVSPDDVKTDPKEEELKSVPQPIKPDDDPKPKPSVPPPLPDPNNLPAIPLEYDVPSPTPQTRKEWDVYIKRNPIGERVLPLPYLKLYFEKLENVSWERMYMLANEEYREKQRQQLERLREYQSKKEAARLAKQQEEAEKARKEKEEADRAEEERLRQIQLKEEEERQQREREEKKAKAEFSSCLPNSLIEISSGEEFSDMDEPKDPVDKPKIKEEKDDPDFKKLENVSNNGNGNKPKPDGGEVPNGDANPGQPGGTKPEAGDNHLKIPAEIKTEPKSPQSPKKGDTGNEPVLFKPVRMDPRTDQIQSTLTELGNLIVDEDVLYALRNLKQVGRTMKQALENDAEALKSKNGNQSCGRNLFRDMNPNLSGINPVNILTPLNAAATIKREHMSGFSSPPHCGDKAFTGRKRLDSEAFIDSYGSSSSTAKRRRTGSTPARGSNLSSPGQNLSTTDILRSQSEAKSKLAIAADTFIRKKKLTNNNRMAIFDAVSNKNRAVIQFDEGPQSFYKIMTHYTPNLNFVPEDVKHKELQQQLFAFIMENNKYTKSWAFPYLTKHGKMFSAWIAEMEKDDAEPDGLAVLMMSHYIGRNITLVSGKGEEWKAEDIADDVVLIYRGDYQFTPTDVAFLKLGYKREDLDVVEPKKQCKAANKNPVQPNNDDNNSNISDDSSTKSSRKKAKTKTSTNNCNKNAKVDAYLEERKKSNGDSQAEPLIEANYICPICKFTCNHSDDFIPHMSEKHNKTAYCCVTGVCILWYLSQNGLRQHCKKFHSDVLKCNSCELVCLSPSLLTAHKDSSHSAKKGTCPSCFKTFTRADDAKRHHEKSCTRNPNRSIRCKQCLKNGNEVDVPGAELGLLNHLTKEHFFKGSMLCPFCHRVFDSEVKIESHHKICTKNRPEK